MTVKLGVVMDSIAEAIYYKKDTTLAMLWEASHRGWQLYYFEMSDLFLRDGKAYGYTQKLKVFKDPTRWFELEEEQQIIALEELDTILMRKDPPVDIHYLYATQILEHAERAGVFIVNKPQALRDANEKLFAAWFPECCPATLVTQRIDALKAFLKEQKEIICKPLDAMGGQSIFYLQAGDKNASVIFETMTEKELKFVMVQRFIPEIKLGDKRIILINGEPIPYALARIPAPGEIRGNLAAGATGVAQPLSDRDRWICQQVGPTLRDKGLYFVGLDVIGDYLTEINVTSPTCVRELDQQCNLNISAILLDYAEQQISK